MENALKSFLYKIQNLMDLFYYYYYRFYKYKLKEEGAHMTTILALTILYQQIIDKIVGIFLILVFGIYFNIFAMIVTWGIIFIIMYNYYIRKGLAAKIIKEKAPVIMGSEKIAILCSWFLFLLAVCSTILGGHLIRYLYNR